jgi:hypothetical protein
MARVAELSMVKLKLSETERKRVQLEELLVDSVQRMDQGLPPNRQCEQEWKRVTCKPSWMITVFNRPYLQLCPQSPMTATSSSRRQFLDRTLTFQKTALFPSLGHTAQWPPSNRRSLDRRCATSGSPNQNLSIFNNVIFYSNKIYFSISGVFALAHDLCPGPCTRMFKSPLTAGSKSVCFCIII